MHFLKHQGPWVRASAPPGSDSLLPPALYSGLAPNSETKHLLVMMPNSCGGRAETGAPAPGHPAEQCLAPGLGSCCCPLGHTRCCSRLAPGAALRSRSWRFSGGHTGCRGLDLRQPGARPAPSRLHGLANPRIQLSPDTCKDSTLFPAGQEVTVTDLVVPWGESLLMLHHMRGACSEPCSCPKNGYLKEP